MKQRSPQNVSKIHGRHRVKVKVEQSLSSLDLLCQRDIQIMKIIWDVRRNLLERLKLQTNSPKTMDHSRFSVNFLLALLHIIAYNSYFHTYLKCSQVGSQTKTMYSIV